MTEDPTSKAAMSKSGYVAWDLPLGKWLPTEPLMISPDGTRYIPEDVPNEIADATTGAALATFPSGDYDRVIGWTTAGIYETHIGMAFVPGLWRIDASSGTVTNLTPNSQVIWEIVDNGSAWGFEWSPTNQRIIDRLDLPTGSIRQLYTAPVGEDPDAVAFVGSKALVLVNGTGPAGLVSLFVLGQDGSKSPVTLQPQLSAPQGLIHGTLQDGQATLFSGGFGIAAYDASHGFQVLFESPQTEEPFLLGFCEPT